MSRGVPTFRHSSDGGCGMGIRPGVLRSLRC